MDIITYECPKCGRRGQEMEMEIRRSEIAGDELWSNWACPQCGTWWNLDDYIQVIEDAADSVKHT